MTDHEREVRVVLAERVMGYRYSHDLDGAPVFIWPAGGDARVYDFDPFEWQWAGRLLEVMREGPRDRWGLFVGALHVAISHLLPLGGMTQRYFVECLLKALAERDGPHRIAEAAYAAVTECGEKIP